VEEMMAPGERIVIDDEGMFNRDLAKQGKKNRGFCFFLKTREIAFNRDLAKQGKKIQ
jgi:hypothetical protein